MTNPRAYQKKVFTLLLIHTGGRVLLGMKKKGLGARRWNGFGGKVEEGESIEAAARREAVEEAGVDVDAKILKKAGILEFYLHDSGSLLEVHVFRANDFSGEPQESDEMQSRWFDVGDIPYGEMWPDDRYWMPLFLAGKRFHGIFHFKDTNTLERHVLRELPAPLTEES